MKQSFQFRSRIAARISKKLLLIYSIIYLIILTALFLVLTPWLYRNSLKQHIQMQSIFSKEYASFQALLSEGLGNLSDNFFRSVTAYEQNPTAANRAKIVQELSAYVAPHENYAVVGLHLPNGEYISSFYYTNLPQEELLTNNVHYQNVLSSQSSSYYSPVYLNQLITINTDTNKEDFLFYSQKYVQGTNSYTLTLFYNVTNILLKNNALNASYFDSYTIIDKYNDVIYTTDDSLPQDLQNYTDKLSGTSGHFKIRKGLCFYQYIPATGWQVASYISYYHLLEEVFWIMGIVTALYLLSPFLYSIFLLPLAARQLLPLKSLADTMSEFQAGKAIYSQIHTDDEIEDLSNTFNKMVEEINHQVEDIRKQEHENAVVSYKLLATQIDPHFIYNTMNIINVMARKGKTAEIIELNTALTRILRERLNSKLSISDTIRNEYETMLQYGTIMDYRYEHQIITHYDIDENLMDRRIPKNILQPLAENSFYHGFGNMEAGLTGNIDIMIYSIDKEIIIEVSDNGQGMSRERLQQIESQSYSIYADQKPHIGLNNIQQRLRFIYGNSQKMEIHSTPGLGTTIIITIPIEFPAVFLD